MAGPNDDAIRHAIAWRPIVRRYLLLIATTLLCVVLAEGLLQIIRRQPETSFEFDPLLGWNAKLHFTGRQRSPEFDVLVRTNGQRMRESKDFALDTDAYRITVVGDSFVWGHGVEEEERFTERLEEKLGPGFEVLNFGIAGFGSGQQLLKLQQDVLLFRPDLLVVAFFLNDLVELSRDRSQELPKPRFVERNGKLELTGVPLERSEIWDHPPRELKLPKLLGAALDRVSGGGARGFFGPHIGLFRRHQDEWLDRSLHLNDLIYTEISELAREADIALVVVELPFKEYFLPDDVLRAEFHVTREQLRFDRVGRRLGELAERRGFVYIDLSAEFERVGALENFFPLGAHYNTRGHETVAQALYEGLGGSGLLPR
jgi:lysophospholipase L1-like esterase